MNLSSSQIKKRRCIHFASSFMYVVDLPIKVQAELQEKTVLLLDESHSSVKSCCYRSIWKHLNNNDKLREQLTGSIVPASLSQVIDMAGYGIVTTNTIQAGKHVVLSYHPRLHRSSFGDALILGTCELGMVKSVD